MKVVLAAVNAKYPHLSLAPWCLKAACNDSEDKISILEMSINQSVEELTRLIYREQPEVLALSCYIFNIALIESVLRDIKKIMPQVFVILGGPEVSFDGEEVLMRNPSADFVIAGEGEIVFPRLLEALRLGLPCEEIPGVTCRTPDGIKTVPPAPPIAELDSLPSPFTEEMLSAAKGKILYFESSRGCPFACAYCLSSVSGGVRCFGLERVRRDLTRIVEAGVQQVKFVDRTFNCNLKRAKEIVKLILELTQKYGCADRMNFHFEAAADLFDDELIDLLASAPEGLFQLEIGLQSFNRQTLEICSRKTNLQKCSANIQKLMRAQNMHIHLDLIAGLPFEDLGSFADSFNKTYTLAPHCIQLGFLKVLRGSAMREIAGERGMLYHEDPPYEVICTPELSFDELLTLKGVEHALDRLYNSGHFTRSLHYLSQRFRSPFGLFLEFSHFAQAQEGYERGISLKSLYDIFHAFASSRLSKEEMFIFNELLKYDYFLSDNSCNPPACIQRIDNPQIRALYSSMKKTTGRMHFETFEFNPLQYLQSEKRSGRTILCFDYSKKHRVTGLYSVT